MLAFILVNVSLMPSCVGLVEWFYKPHGTDVDFLSKGFVSDDHLLQLRTWNSVSLTEISSLDHIVVPTAWQQSQLLLSSSSSTVIHEGIDYDNIVVLKNA